MMKNLAIAASIVFLAWWIAGGDPRALVHDARSFRSHVANYSSDQPNVNQSDWGR